MGQLDIPLADIEEEISSRFPSRTGLFQRWYQLKHRSGLHHDGKITGDLLLKFEIVRDGEVWYLSHAAD